MSTMNDSDSNLLTSSNPDHHATIRMWWRMGFLQYRVRGHTYWLDHSGQELDPIDFDRRHKRFDDYRIKPQ